MHSSETHHHLRPSNDFDSDDETDTKPLTGTTHEAPEKKSSSPFSSWIRLLSSKFSPTFVLGVVLVYGLSQGFSFSFFKVVSDYYWKDVQKLEPSAVQLFIGLYTIPWLMKPFWGLLTDVFPVKGYHRRPYFILAGVVGVASASSVAFGGHLPVVLALICLIGVMAGIAIADVTIDACIARNSIAIRSLATDMQSLSSVCSSAGALIGYSTSGFFVSHLGPQISLGLLGISPAAIIALGFVFHEQEEKILMDVRQTTLKKKLQEAVNGMQKTIQLPQVWKPAVYLYLSIALSFSTHEGQFYWYTDPNAGPAFSKEFVGIIYAIGASASIVGVIIYHKYLRDHPFRSLVFFGQLLFAASGVLDLIFILRWNLKIGIPDYLFVVTETCTSKIVSRLRGMPMMVLCSQLCPVGIEGTFFALLMCIDSLGELTAKWCGGMVLNFLGVTRTDFRHLWLAIAIRNSLRFLTLGLVFLIPNSVPTDVLIPAVSGGGGGDDGISQSVIVKDALELLDV